MLPRWIKDRLKDESGIALVIVMMASMALMILVIEFVYTTRVNYRMAQNLRNQLQAEYMAKSALQLSLLVLQFQKQIESVQSRVGDDFTLFGGGPLYQQIPIDSQLLRTALQLGGTSGAGPGLTSEDQKGLTDFLNFSGNFVAKIEDEQGKINLNSLATTSDLAAQGSGEQANGQPTPSPSPSPSPEEGEKEQKITVSEMTMEQLLALMESDDYDPIFEKHTREEIVFNMLDWVDADTRRSGYTGGSEDGLYMNLDSPYQAKNAKFDSVKEVSLIDGVNQEFIDTFENSLTVYGNSNRINLNTASRTLLKGVVGKLIDSSNDEAIEEVVDWIDEFRTFKDQAEFLEGLKTNFGYETADLDEVFLSTFTFQSTIFSITAQGTVGDELEDGEGPQAVSTTIRAIIFKPSKNSATGDSSRSFPSGIKFFYWRVN